MKAFVLLCIFLFITPLHSQSLTFFDIKEDNFPSMQAKFYAFDIQGDLQRLTGTDLNLQENGTTRPIIQVTCPPLPQPIALSSVLVMDISGSMQQVHTSVSNMDLAKIAGNVWVSSLPLTISECAVVAFDNNNYLYQDFTNNEQDLKDAISALQPQGGTNYNAALIEQSAGGLIVAERGKNKRVIVFLTDGVPSQQTNINDIIAEANKLNCSIYCVTLGMPASPNIVDIANRTGGLSFANIETEQQIMDAYRIILADAQGMEPCEITWESAKQCNATATGVELSWNSVTAYSSYNPPKSAIISLQIDPRSIDFGGVAPNTTRDTTITVSAQDTDITIEDMAPLFGVGNFTVISPQFPVVVPANTSRDITLRFAPIDSSFQYMVFELTTDLCNKNIGVSGGFPGQPLTQRTLRLTFPNGDEQFVVGSDSIITWEGIAETDSCTLEYSFDGGQTWNLITNQATGLRYEWKNIPHPASQQCLVRVSQDGTQPAKSDPTIEWQYSFGGSDLDAFHGFDQTDDGGYIVTGYSNSNNGDIVNSFGGADRIIAKFTALGDLEWSNNYGDSTFNIGNAIKQTPDGGFIIAGLNNDIRQQESRDALLLKVDMQGTVEWEKEFGGSLNDGFVDLKLTPDGGYIVCGYSYSSDNDIAENKGFADCLVARFTSTGDVMWSTTFGGSSGDQLQAIDITSDGNYIVVGRSSSDDGDIPVNKGKDDCLIAMLNDNGEILNIQTYGGSKEEYGFSIQALADGNSVFVASTQSSDGDVGASVDSVDSWFVILDENGTIIQQQIFSASKVDYPYSVTQLRDGGFAIATLGSNVTSPTSNFDYNIIRTDQSGQMLWSKAFGGFGSDIPRRIEETIDGGLLIVGSNGGNSREIKGNRGLSDGWIVKLNSQEQVTQMDTSDAVFSIVEPVVTSIDIDMKQCLVGNVKDSLVADVISNAGTFPFTVTEVLFQGADASAFQIVSGMPPTEISSNQSHSMELRFTPSRVGLHQANMLIITQADTLRQSIIGEGILSSVDIATQLIDFGKVSINSQKDTLQVVTITNTSNAPLTITNTFHGTPNDIDFMTLAGGGNFTLASGDTARVDLRFSPSNVGRTSGRLLFEYNDVGSPATVQLFGEGVDTTSDAPSSLTLQIGNKQAFTNDIVTIPIFLANSPTTLLSGNPSVQTDITFNPSLLFPLDFPMTYNTPTSASISLNSIPLQNPQQGDTLIFLRFQVGIGNAERCDVRFANAILKDNDKVSLNTADGVFDLLGICEEGGMRLINPEDMPGSMEIAPNPSHGRITVTFNAIEEGFMELVLYNTLGEKVQTLFAGDITNNFGRRSMEADISNLGTGKYILKITTPTYFESKNVIITQ
jgi:uncharacterized protein YegL